MICSSMKEFHVRNSSTYNSFSVGKSLAAVFFFQKMDRNKDGVVTIEEFIESCKKVGQQELKVGLQKNH